MKRFFPHEQNRKTSCWMYMWLVRRLVWSQFRLKNLSMIKKANFSDYIIIRRSDKFTSCSKCKTLKPFRMHIHQIIHYPSIELFQGCEHTRGNIVIIVTKTEYCPWPSHWRSSRSPMIKMNHAKRTSSYFAYQIKAIDGIFKLHIFVISNVILSNILYLVLCFMGFYNSISSL